MSDILDRILAKKAEEVAAAQAARPREAIDADAHAAAPARDFAARWSVRSRRAAPR